MDRCKSKVEQLAPNITTWNISSRSNTLKDIPVHSHVKNIFHKETTNKNFKTTKKIRERSTGSP